MSTNDNVTIQIPSFVTTLLHSYAQKAVTAAATALITAGWLTPNQQGQFVTVGLGVLAMAGSMVWTAIRSKIDTNRTVAIAAGTPTSKP